MAELEEEIKEAEKSEKTIAQPDTYTPPVYFSLKEHEKYGPYSGSSLTGDLEFIHF